MKRDQLLAMIREIQSLGSELDDVEVKSAKAGMPTGVFKSLSAFANRTGGGTVLFGLSESHGFGVEGVFSAQRLQEKVADLASSEMEPPVAPVMTVVKVEEKRVVAAEIPEIPPEQRPCYYRPQGPKRGSYIRVGNTTRRMSDYEVFGYVSAREQPREDCQPVTAAARNDLDPEAIESYVSGLRTSRPHAGFLARPLDEILQQVGVLVEIDGELRPTLAGLLVFGKYPQSFQPQLGVTFVHYYGETEGEATPSGERFLDNRRFEGPIPTLVDEAVRHLLASIRKSSLIDGLLRRDVLEYPMEALREAIVNAVAHRDYSGFVRGSYVQIRLFADRIEIQSPGGLFGNVTEDNIEEEQSTRNATLMRLMEDLHLVENRGSGIAAMIRAMREANLEPPAFSDSRSSFTVTLRSHTLMGPGAIRWLGQFADLPLNDHQRLALAYLRSHSRMTNADYRRLNRVGSYRAGRELKKLVQNELVTQHGVRRGTTYSLAVAPELEEPEPVLGTPGEAILRYVREHGSITNAECRVLLKTGRGSALNHLRELVDSGHLELVGKGRGAKYLLRS